MLDTATAVYEAVEPIIIWRFFFGSVQKPLDVGSKVSSTATKLTTRIWTCSFGY